MPAAQARLYGGLGFRYPNLKNIYKWILGCLSFTHSWGGETWFCCPKSSTADCGEHKLSKGNRTVSMPPSLLELCEMKVVANLLDHRGKLGLLPLDLQISLVSKVMGKKPKPSLYELEILCEAFWKPTELFLRGVEPLNVRALPELTFISSLVKLDLSGCGSWLDSLKFLRGLSKLECLNLRDCWRLSGNCLACIQQLPRLRCLDLENLYMITDAWASYTIPGMRDLQALNMTGTSISDGFLEALTYGCRLQSWAAEQHWTTDSEGPIESVLGQYPAPGQYPALDLVFLRLQHTKITEHAVHLLSCFKQLMLLDVRSTELHGRSLYNIKGNYGLIALPNNSKLLGKTNSVLLSVVRGACGCSSKALQISAEDDGRPSWVTTWEESNILNFLREASSLQNRSL